MIPGCRRIIVRSGSSISLAGTLVLGSRQAERFRNIP